MRPRKLIFGISCIMCMTIFLCASNSFAKFDSASIAGAWLFDEGNGGEAKDISNNKNDGMLVGDPQWVDGKFGEALDFNGTNDYVEIPDNASLDITDNITITAWIFKRSDDIHGGTIVSKWKQTGDVWAYVLYGLGDSGGGFRLRWDDSSQTNLEGPYQLPNDEWLHYAATYDGSIMKVFQNAKEIENIAADKKINSEDNPVWIGNDGYQQHFSGILDEIAIFNAALDESDIMDVMNKGLASISAVYPSGKMTETWGKIKSKI